MRSSSPERVRCVRSSSDSVMASTAPTSRRPHASVSEKIGVSALPTASSSTSCDGDLVAAGPRCELLDLARELVEVVADDLDERAARLLVRLRAEPAELLADPLWQLSLRHVVREQLARLRDRLRERRVGLQLARDECEHGVGGGAARYAATAFASSAFQRSTSSTMTSLPPPTKSPSALQVAIASSPLASRALRCSVESSPMRSRRRRRARAIFGRSLPDRR